MKLQPYNPHADYEKITGGERSPDPDLNLRLVEPYGDNAHKVVYSTKNPNPWDREFRSEKIARALYQERVPAIGGWRTIWREECLTAYQWRGDRLIY